MNKALKEKMITWFRVMTSAVREAKWQEYHLEVAYIDFPVKPRQKLNEALKWESQCYGEYEGMLETLIALGLEKEARTLRRLNYWAQVIGNEQYLKMMKHFEEVLKEEEDEKRRAA